MPLRPANICPGCSELRHDWETTCPCGYVTPAEQAVLDAKEAERLERIEALKTSGVRPQIDIDLFSSHGNVFVVMASVDHAMKDWGIEKKQRMEVMRQAKTGDYENALRTMDRYVKIMPVGYENLDEFFLAYHDDRRDPDYDAHDRLPQELKESYQQRVMETLKKEKT